MSTDKSQSYGYHANGRTGFYMDLGKTNVSLFASGTNIKVEENTPFDYIFHQAETIVFMQNIWL